MRITTDWIADFGLKTETQELAKKYTLAGLEVDEIIGAAPEFSAIVVGEILSLEKHPDADKLRVAKVDAGTGETLQIVCGAPNAHLAKKVPVALIGANLPGGLKIKKSKLRGIESSGMLCSALELGISEDHSGLLILPDDAPVGMSIREYLNLDEQIIDIDLTPNRADAFSIRGLAREAFVLYGQKPTQNLLSSEQLEKANQQSEEKISVNNEAKEDCPIYYARVIKNVNNNVKTPFWLAEKLRRLGIRPHDPLVDITNYVMMYLGTPMHAFDAREISGGICIRHARDAEKLTLINGFEISLSTDDLLIADHEKPLALAGVMGGIHSGCSNETNTVVLESAWFNPDSIIGKARKYCISSDAAQRYERGVDYSLQIAALEMATRLILEICGGESGKICGEKNEQYLPQRASIFLPEARIKKLSGIEVSPEFVENTLSKLGCKVDKIADGWQVIPPIWRFDLVIYQDLIEEIIRIYGYENIPESLALCQYQKDKSQAQQELQNRRWCSDLLRSLGFCEAISYSFISRAQHRTFFAEEETVNLFNPISAEMSEMRLSILPGLVSAAIYNRRRQQLDLRLFELGNCFLKNGENAVETKQIHRVAGVLCGRANPEQWSVEQREIDFFDLKAVVEKLLEAQSLDFRRSTASFMHPGLSADVFINDQKCGLFGALHPQKAKELGYKSGKLWVFELDSKYIYPAQLSEFVAPAKFPSVRRDLAIVLDDSVSAQDVLSSIKETAGKKLLEIFCFDVFYGKELGENKKSLAVGIVLQDLEKTLQEEEVDKIINEILSTLSNKFNAQLR